jgi:hypothetical protein
MKKTKNNPEAYLSRSKISSGCALSQKFENPRDDREYERDFEHAHIDANFYFTFHKKGKF